MEVYVRYLMVLIAKNCHLNAGTAPLGNNYGAVASTYPKIRARSGQSEDIPKRINDCFERSLNGQGLERDSKEMMAYGRLYGMARQGCTEG